MKTATLLFLLFALSFVACQNTTAPPPTVNAEKTSTIPETPGAMLIKEMIDALGGLNAYQQLKDVEYTYIYKDVLSGQQDVSLERYHYNGERSWAKYTEHTKSVFPETPGIVLQGYDGKSSWTSLDGELITDAKALARADFLRKTNFYWLNMMFKLLDPGTRFEQKPDRNLNSIDYKIVEVSFNEGVGDAQDIYLLYLNPNTKLADQFLFTVMDYDRAEPLLMEVQYETVNGLKWPSYRRYTASDWEGAIPEDAKWTEEISKNLKFNNDFDLTLFSAPKEVN